MPRWLQNLLLWLALPKKRATARFVARPLALVAADGLPLIDAATGAKVLAPEGCSFHKAVLPGGDTLLALVTDDPAVRLSVVFPDVPLLEAVHEGQG